MVTMAAWVTLRHSCRPHMRSCVRPLPLLRELLILPVGGRRQCDTTYGNNTLIVITVWLYRLYRLVLACGGLMISGLELWMNRSRVSYQPMQ
jgi:hypothetical protein